MNAELTPDECRNVAGYLRLLKTFTHDDPSRLAELFDRAADTIETLTKRKGEFPADYKLPEHLVMRAILELHLTREEIEAKVAKCVAHHRAKGTVFKRHDLAAWNWLSERFVPNGKPEPPQRTYVHKFTEE